MILLQLALYCLLFVVLVKCAAGNSGLNCLYFYPKEYIEEAERRGLADKDAVMKKGKRFMLPFCVVMFAVLILIISVWNGVTDFKTAYIQSCVFLVVTNWFDGIVVDRLWVGRGKLWVIKGMEGVPYVKPWKLVLTKRAIATVLYLIIALAAAGMTALVAEEFGLVLEPLRQRGELAEGPVKAEIGHDEIKFLTFELAAEQGKVI